MHIISDTNAIALERPNPRNILSRARTYLNHLVTKISTQYQPMPFSILIHFDWIDVVVVVYSSKIEWMISSSSSFLTSLRFVGSVILWISTNLSGKILTYRIYLGGFCWIKMDSRMKSGGFLDEEGE